MTGAKTNMYGLLAEFGDAEALVDAARKVRQAGYRRIDAHTPFPVAGLADALGLRATKIPLVVLLGGIVGAIGAFFFQYYASVIDYPLNVGGRPLNSWPAFIVVTFEMTILAAAVSALLGMFALNGLPMPYHPLFNVKEFDLASRSAFFLSIEAKDALFDFVATRRFLESLNPKGVYDVEW